MIDATFDVAQGNLRLQDQWSTSAVDAIRAHPEAESAISSLNRRARMVYFLASENAHVTPIRPP